MYYVPSIQQDNAPCKSSAKYSRIHQGLYLSLYLSSIDTDCSIVKRPVGRVSNIKDRRFEKSLSNLVHLEFRWPRSPAFGYAKKRIQAVLRTNGGATKCKIACHFFAGYEISFEIKCFAVTVLYMCFNETRTNNYLHLLIHCNIRS